MRVNRCILNVSFCCSNETNSFLRGNTRGRQTISTILGCFGSNGGTLSGDGLESRFDRGDRASRPTCLALEEEEAGVFLQDRIGGATGVAGDVLFHVSPEHILHLFLLETTLDDELIVAIHWTACTQLGKKEGKDVFRLPMESDRTKTLLNRERKLCNSISLTFCKFLQSLQRQFSWYRYERLEVVSSWISSFHRLPSLDSFPS